MARPGNNLLTGTYRGKEEVFGFFGKLMELTDGTWHLDLHDIVGNDDHVVVLARYKAQREGKQPIEVNAAGVWHVTAQGQFTEYWDLLEDQAAEDEFWS